MYGCQQTFDVLGRALIYSGASNGGFDMRSKGVVHGVDCLVSQVWQDAACRWHDEPRLSEQEKARPMIGTGLLTGHLRLRQHFVKTRHHR